MGKKSEELKAEEPELEETKSEELKVSPGNTEYPLADSRTANVAHGGVIYPVVKGKIACSPIIALELIEAGVLKKS
jgi:hypothetical protein